jgi:ubiquinone/menaquinone biosynthesis C-methylase UbiE
MRCTLEELAQKKRFETVYERSQSPVMLSVERRVCGCDYGGTSWLTNDQADELAAHLELQPSTRLLDLGAGSGWPALYFAKIKRCEVVLVDLPEIGLRIAEERAANDSLSKFVSTVVADAADLPFLDNSFDAISHCDLLCCLERKRSVLECCRRVVRPQGRMAFTVISISPGLSANQHRRAVKNGPDFIESKIDYATLLAQTGWLIAGHEDLTAAYAASCQRQIRADEEHMHELTDLLGPDDFAERLAGWREKLATINLGLFRRELFVAIPSAS